jgi:hypothetical protein
MAQGGNNSDKVALALRRILRWARLIREILWQAIVILTLLFALWHGASAGTCGSIWHSDTCGSQFPNPRSLIRPLW